MSKATTDCKYANICPDCGTILPAQLQHTTSYRSTWACAGCGLTLAKSISRCRKGEGDAFVVLVFAHDRGLQRFMAARPGITDDDDLSELLQDTWMAAWLGLQSERLYQRGTRAGQLVANTSQFAEASDFGTWITSIGLNVYLDFNAKRHMRYAINCKIEGDPDSFVDPVFDLACQQPDPNSFDGSAIGIHECIARLSTRQRKVLEAKMEDQPTEQIAQSMGVTASTVRVTLLQARQRVKDLLTGLSIAQRAALRSVLQDAAVGLKATSRHLIDNYQWQSLPPTLNAMLPKSL